MALVSFDIGPYTVHFNEENYDLKRKDGNSVVAKALGSFGQEATVSIWFNDPACPFSIDDKRAILNDTDNRARWTKPSLQGSKATVPKETKINGHDGFYVHIDYRNVQEITDVCERVFCSLDNGYILDIFSIYPVSSEEKSILVGDIVSSIYEIRSRP